MVFEGIGSFLQHGRISKVFQVLDHRSSEQPGHRVEPVDHDKEFDQDPVDGMPLSFMNILMLQDVVKGFLFQGFRIDENISKKGAGMEGLLANN